nr:aspartic protease [Haemonchus contortus]
MCNHQRTLAIDYDIVCFGCGCSYCTNRTQGFGCAISETDKFATEVFYGVLVMAWKSDAAGNISPPLDQIFADKVRAVIAVIVCSPNMQKMCPEALFAFYMGRANNGQGAAGEIQSLAGEKVNVQGAYENECNTTSSLPTPIFTFGGQDFTLQGSDYVVQVFTKYNVQAGLN